MHLFFNDPRVAYVTRHRRIVRHPLVALVAGGVGVAALGVAIGAAGWEPPRQGRPAPQPAHQGMAMPDPVQDINLYGVPAAPQPVLDSGAPPRSLATPAKPQNPANAPRGQVRQVEKSKTPSRPGTSAPSLTPPPPPQPTTAPTTAPTADPTTQPPATEDPTQDPTHEPMLRPTARHPAPRNARPHIQPHTWPHNGQGLGPDFGPNFGTGGGAWPWEQSQQEGQDETPTAEPDAIAP